MKRLTALLMSLALALGLAGCSAPSSLEGVDLDNALVVYFSATGNTGEAAGYIASITGADVFEIVPADPYTSEDLTWTDPESRVSTEHDARVAGETVTVELTQTTPDNWDSYDTVFIGYPIWWGEAAWPVDTFVQSNDFTGKTVIPFCTSASSDLGESGQLLAELAGVYRKLGERLESGEKADGLIEAVKNTDKTVNRAFAFIIENSFLPRMAKLQQQ